MQPTSYDPPQGKRVAFVLPSLAAGGAERVTITLVDELNRAGIETHLVTLIGQGPLASQIPPGVRFHDLGHHRLRSGLFPLLVALRRIKPDVVLSTIGYINLAITLGRSFLPSSTLVFLREANLPSLSLPRARHGALMRFGYRHLYGKADRILCSSQVMAKEFGEAFAIPNDRLALIPNPVAVDAIRREARVPERTPGVGLRFVAAGRLVPQKGFDRLIELATSMPKDSKITILGDGPERERYNALIASLRLSQRVELSGFSAAPWRSYAGADAVILPSRWEGMPNVALEALACGTPVVGTPESGGLSELVTETAAGAVRIESFGPGFRDALLATPRAASPCLRPSLLPERFDARQVAASLCRMIAAEKGSRK